MFLFFGRFLLFVKFPFVQIFHTLFYSTIHTTYRRFLDQTAYIEKKHNNVYFLIVESGLCLVFTFS